MGLYDANQEGIDLVTQFQIDRPLEPPPPPLEKYPSEVIVVMGFLFISYLVFKQLRHRTRSPLSRIALLILIPGYLVSSIYIAHEYGTCGEFRCRPGLWSVLSAYLSYDAFQIIIPITVASFIVAFFSNETVMKLVRWVMSIHLVIRLDSDRNEKTRI
jgi:hypothetical protein